MHAIQVSHFGKSYRIIQKSPGAAGTLRSLINPHYEHIAAVNDISFSIAKGELVGFIGPNGAGKTTTLKCLSGLLYPDRGSMRVLGYTPQYRQKEFLKKISLVFGQKNQLWWDLPAIETLELQKEIYEIPQAKFEKNIHTLSHLLQVHTLLSVPVRKLSLGQRMKIELIAALIYDPAVLFLDEPTIGLDVVMQKVMRDFIGAYNRRFRATILLTSHYMADVKALCSRVIILDHGRILYDGKLSILIGQYADAKVVSLLYRDEKNASKMKRMTLLIPRTRIAEETKKLLQKHTVEDVTIEDPAIEDVIRHVFAKSKATFGVEKNNA